MGTHLLDTRCGCRVYVWRRSICIQDRALVLQSSKVMRTLYGQSRRTEAFCFLALMTTVYGSGILLMGCWLETSTAMTRVSGLCVLQQMATSIQPGTIELPTSGRSQ